MGDQRSSRSIVRSGKAVARTGLRMMPTFPPPPLKFRTAGFPQYGFKISLSDPACPGRREVKPAPGIPSGASGFAMILRTPPATGSTGLRSLAPKGNPEGSSPQDAPLTPGVLGSDLRYAVSDPPRYYDPIRQSRRHEATSRVFLASRPRLRCAGAPRRPARPSRLSLACCPPVPPTLPRWVRWSLPLSGHSDTRLPRITSESPPTAPSLPAMLDGGPFRGCIVRVRLRPVRLPGPPGWRQRGAGTPCTPLAEVPCHSRFWHWPSPDSAGSQARWANGKSPIVGTCTRPVTTGSEAAR